MELQQRLVVSATLCLALAVSITACTLSKRRSGGDDVRLGATSTSNLRQLLGNDGASLPSPLQTYRLTPAELAIVDHARGVLIARCMGRAGFSYQLPPLDVDVHAFIASEREAISRIYGITNPAEAAEFGYGFPPSAELEPSPPPAQRRQYFKALRGDLDPRTAPQPAAEGLPSAGEGCVGEADRRIGQTDQTTSLYGLAHSLWIKGQQDLLSSRTYAGVRSDWIGCMAGKGFHVTDPIADRGDIAAVFAARAESGDERLGGPPVEGEVRLAVADVACKSSVGLVEQLRAVGDRIDQSTIRKHLEQLRTDRRRLDLQVATAARILEPHGGQKTS